MTGKRYLQRMNIRNTSVLITGGSQGLGRGLGEALAASGARVVLVARHEDKLNEAVREIQALGGEVYGIAADIGAAPDRVCWRCESGCRSRGP